MLTDEEKDEQDETSEEDGTSVDESQTSEDEPIQFDSQEKLDKYVEDTIAARGRELAADARQEVEDYKTENALLQKQIDKQEGIIDGLRQQEDDDVVALLKDNPDALALNKVRVKLRSREAALDQREAKLDTREAKLTTREASAKKGTALADANAIAADYSNLSGQELLNRTDGTKEAMKDFAKAYGKPKGKKGKEQAGGGDRGIIPGTGTGKRGKLTEQQKLDKRYPTMAKK